MTEDEVADAAWQWIRTTVGVEMIHAYQSGGEPCAPYGVIALSLVGPVREHPTDYEFRVSDEGLETEEITQAPVFEWFWRFSVNVYGDQGMTSLRRLKMAQWVQTAAAPLRPLVLFEVSDIRNLTEMINEAWTPRAQVDVEFRGFIRDGQVIDTAETAAVSITKA